MKTLVVLWFCLLALLPGARAQWVQLQYHNSGISGTTRFQSIQVLDANNIWAVGYQDKIIIKTTNGGQSWTTMQVADPTFSQFYIEAISVLNPDTAWLTATTPHQPPQTRIYKTTNGGASWHHQAAAYQGTTNQRASVVYFFDAQNGLNLGETFLPSNPLTAVPQIMLTSDGGSTWQEVPAANLPAAQANAGIQARSFAVVKDTIWYIGKDHWVYRSTDKGYNWTKSDPGFPNPGTLYAKNAIAFSDARNGLAVNNGTLKRTNDGGTTWQTVTPTGTPYSDELVAVPGVYSTFVSASKEIGAPGSSVSTDNGNTWRNLTPYFVSANTHIDMQFISPSTGWSAGSGSLSKFNSTITGFGKAKATVPGFTIYPNPSSTGIFTISGPANQAFRAEVYTITGLMIVQQQSHPFGPTRLNLTAQPKGIYLLRILSQGQVFIRRIVLN